MNNKVVSKNRLLSALFLGSLIFSPIIKSDDKQSIQSLDKAGVPVEINCDQGIICERSKNICTATGHVVVTYESHKLTCSHLIAYFRTQQDLKNELYKIEALDDATLTTDETIIQSDFLRAHLNKSNDRKYALNEVEVLNNVVITTPDEIATSDKGIYYPQKQLIILKENVTIASSNGQIKGPYAEVDLDKGVSKMLIQDPLLKSSQKPKSERIKVLILPKGAKQ